LCIALASTAWAGIPDLDNSTAVTAATVPVSVLLCPACDGDPFSAARVYGGGSTHDATITVTLLDINFIPVVGYPAEDVWFDATGLCFCTDGNIADYDSDASGQTQFATAPCGGGCSPDADTVIYINGEALHQPAITGISYNSPDMDCSLVVDLTDVVMFAGIFYGSYDYCGDFYWDGVINLSDIVVLAQHLGHVCP